MAVVVPVYWLLPRRAQNYFLLAASYFFYGFVHPWFCILIAFSTLFDWLVALAIARHPGRKRALLIASLAANLGLLGAFKYFDFFVSSFQAAMAGLGFQVSLPLLRVMLPVGISFYTFQSLSYTIDVYRGLLQPRRSLPDFALFVALFPQLVAGPIVKARDFLPQIRRKTPVDIDWPFCFRALVIGYFLKMVVADNLKDYTCHMAFPQFEIRSTVMLTALLAAFSMQIFADFAGYSLIAIGTAGLFGYRLKPNFNFPYVAQSFSDFWRRWHMSLSSFLKEYLYFPLGGNRRGRVRTYVNVMIVMLLGGLWHGAAWSYAVWGGAHGAALALERFLGGRDRPPRAAWVGALRAAGVFAFVTAAWLLFQLPRFGDVVRYAHAMARNARLPTDIPELGLLLFYSAPVALYHAGHVWRRRFPASRLSAADPLWLGLMLFLLVTNSGSPRAFIYFQF